MNKKLFETEEQKRLEENKKKSIPLELWGPYLSERQWGTVREDYSANGDAVDPYLSIPIFLRQALHEHFDGAFRRRIIYMSGPWNKFMH